MPSTPPHTGEKNPVDSPRRREEMSVSVCQRLSVNPCQTVAESHFQRDISLVWWFSDQEPCGGKKARENVEVS